MTQHFPAPNVITAEVVSNSVRQSIEHEKYSTPKVQLAWGREIDTKKIQHVTNVDRGKNCNCACPACGEPLISRQGDIRIWHFAHDGEQDCKGALSAAFSQFLAQWLSGGSTIDLPASEFRYGSQTHEIPEQRNFAFTGAKAEESPDGYGWVVMARLDHGNQTSYVRIILRTNPKQRMPSWEECVKSQLSTLIVDVGHSLSHMIETDPERCTDEEWITEEIVRGARRYWIYTAASSRRFEELYNRRVKPLVDEIERLQTADISDTPVSDAYRAMQDIQVHQYLTRERVSGDSVIPMSTLDWKAKVMLELIVKPIARVHPGVPSFEDISIGWKEASAACKQLELMPSFFLKGVGQDDWNVMQAVHGDIVQPMVIIEDFLDQLHSQGALLRRPRTQEERYLPEYDIRFDNADPLKTFSVSQLMLHEIMWAFKEDPELRERVLTL